MSRKPLAVLILLAWAAGLGLLVRREYFKPSAVRLREATLRVGPGAEFYAVSLGAAPIGYASSTVDTTTAGLTVQDAMVVDIAALGEIQRTEVNTELQLTRDLKLLTFDAVLTSPKSTFRVHGDVSGDTLLAITLDAGAGQPQTSRVRLRRPVVMATLLPLQLAVGRQLAPGASFDVAVFDPLELEERTVTVRVEAESVLVVADSAQLDPRTKRWVTAHDDTLRAWKVSEEYGGIATESWIDRQGRIVSAVSPIGFTMRRLPFEMAVQNWRLDAGRQPAARPAPPAGGAGDIIAATAIAADVTLAPDTLSTLRVRLGNVRLGGFDLTGGRQRLAGDTLTVTREAGVGSVPGAAPPLYLVRLPVTDTAVAGELASEPLVQSDDPRIQAQARQIVGRERRAGPVAEALTHWVYRDLKKEIVIGVPSAVQVLQDGRGDCNEHTVLYVALARALGLPARTAAGIVYLRGRFYYHAWPEVWLGRWVAVDPTFDQFPADASHLRFVIGGLARQVELLRLIGRLKVTALGAGG